MKSFLLLSGSYVFAYCLGVTLHEIGHAIGYLLLDLPSPKIYVHPFAKSYSQLLVVVPETVLPFTSLMGPLFNVLIGTIVMCLLWIKRNPTLVPFIVMAPVAYFQEGVSIFIDLIDLPNYTDWGTIIAIGKVSPLIVAVIGIFLIIVGLLSTYLIFPLLNISIEDPLWMKLAVLSGIILYSTLSLLYVFIFDPTTTFWRLLGLLSSIILTLCLFMFHGKSYRFVNLISQTDTMKVKNSDIGISIGLSIIIIAVDLIIFS